MAAARADVLDLVDKRVVVPVAKQRKKQLYALNEAFLLS